MYDFQRRTAEITNASIQKRFSSFTPSQMIAEYIWNGLDAEATRIDVVLNNNQLGGIESIEIHDNGKGIDFSNSGENFGKFDDSSKQEVTQKGSQGRGRYSFQKFATKAAWYTRNNREDALIEIDSTELAVYNLRLLNDGEQKTRLINNDRGTSVYLTSIPKDKGAKIPLTEELVDDLAIEFGWKLAVFPELKIFVNEQQVSPSENELFKDTFEIEGHEFDVSIIRWMQKPKSEKSNNYYLDSKGSQRHVELSGFNNKFKLKFFISGCIQSKWFDNFNLSNSKNSDFFIEEQTSESSTVYKELTKRLRKWSATIYANFLRSQANEMVSDFESKGYFPLYSNESQEDKEFRIQHTKQVVAGIHVAEPSTFTNLKPKQIKILIALLDKLTVSNENDSLLDVLEGVLELNKAQLKEFSSQIKKSKLDHIISTIGLIQKRDEVVHKMKRLFKDHSEHVLETPDLQGIIEANTWLFGAQYETIGAEEPDFYENAKNLWSKDKEIEGLSCLEQEDLIEGATIEGAKGEVDLFLAKKLLTVDHSTGEEFIKCTIIEIKRPSLSLNNKCVRQVERYREVLERHPAFNDEKMRFDVILVGTKFSQNATNIKTRLKDNAGKAGQGLLLGAEDRIKVYVKTWATIFNDFDITHKHLLNKLRINRDELQTQTKDESVKELQEHAD
ncbi:MAG: ATP-binding protein [Parashewanella sp.]